MNRRSLFGMLTAEAVAVALPIAKRAAEAVGYTVLKLPHDLPTGSMLTFIKMDARDHWIVLGGSELLKLPPTVYPILQRNPGSEA